MNPQDNEPLEAAIHRVLRRLPDRKAPRGLEDRVFAELARRAALPWWRASFSHWPSSVRAAFFAGSAVAALLLVWTVVTVCASNGASQVAGGISESFSWLVLARDIIAAAETRLRIALSAMPTFWLLTAAGIVAFSYAALAAIGAATYRAVTFARQTA